MTDEKQRLRAARSYDGAAGVYERVNAPLLFDAPARALVAAAAPYAHARILDVGCGTGAVSRAAHAAVDGAAVVAVDPALDMLEAARRGGAEAVVNASLPHLPFVDASFDVVLCAFVLTHVDDPDAALTDMKRVLRPGGCVGVSAWAQGDDDYTAAWSEVVGRYVDADRMARAAAVILPADARFSQPSGQADALRACGFERVQSYDIDFEFALTVEEYVEGREVCASGRALRSLLSKQHWDDFRRDARSTLALRFPRGIKYRRRVYLATGATV